RDARTGELGEPATESEAEVARADESVSDRTRGCVLSHLTDPSERPAAMCRWMKRKKSTEGTTTTTDAASIAPQSRTSEPLREYSATVIGMRSLLLMKSSAKRNSLNELMNV